jgi:hypothetical protein
MACAELVDLEPGSDEELELRGVWLCRRMFGWIVGMPEHRTYDEWLRALGMRLA